jgi:HSP20 family protein
MTELTPFSFRTALPGSWREYDTSPFQTLGQREWTPFAAFRREIDRLFEDFSRTPVFSRYGHGPFSRWPTVDIHETNDEVIVTAEVPGMSEKDIELYFDKGVLTMRGFKKVDKDEPNYSERHYGRFERQIELPYPVDGEHCAAEFSNGLLTITFDKLAAAAEKNKIPIKSATKGKTHETGKESKVAEKSRQSAFVSA